jgi:2-polyprenyl-3-methyl-5-hydroxy-6-metoxy-1,4-benzoquinol methylase
LRRLHFRLGPLQFGLWVARWNGRAAELPYQDVIDEAERSGTVLHRENIYRSGPPVDAVSDEILGFVLSNVEDTVLDIGCGAGPYVARINGSGKRCIGIDLDPRAVEQAQALGRPVFPMSADNLAFADNAFDSVVLIETLEHLPNYDRALSEAARVARSSVVVTVPDISVIPRMSKRQVVPWHLLEATHVNFFTPETLRTTLLRYASSCNATQLGDFFDVDGEVLHMHAAAVARL